MTTTRSQAEIDKIVREHSNTLGKISSFMDETRQSFAEIREVLEEIRRPKHSEGPSGVNFDTSNGSRADRLYRFGKIEFPKFDGTEDVEDWVSKCEHYFDVDDTPEAYKVRYAVINLEGKAIKWHNNFIKNRLITGVTWSEYSRTIIDRFSSTLFQDGMGILISTTQTGTLEDYCDKFDENLLRVTISEEYAVNIFLRGLKPELSGLVRVLDPKSMKQAYMLAKKQI
ncbi:uncharacterized protein LOC143532581 [Bidens hawaiensis]|uniref:uncharacterized protein LOC143532581 n=1 Tax=Bidens hawaiensis TaxID=980011 RepID=UPI004049AC67